MISVLYVDDETALLDISKRYLEKTGDFTVDTAESAQAALGMIRATPYDAIVSDYQMPGMDGIEFLKTLRASRDSTPFIIFTGKGREEVVIQAFENGADFYLQKGGEPKVQFVELAHKIKTAVEGRRTEEALRESNKRLAEACSIAHLGFWELDLQTQNHIWSEEVYNLFGVMPGSFVPTQEHFLQTVHPEDLEPMLALLARTVETSVPFRMDYRAILPDGSIRFMQEEAVVRRDELNEALSLFGTVIDITDRKRAEEALKMANKTLKLLGSTTRHEINNQLLVVQGYLELLHDEVPDPALEHYFTRITNARARISNMIQFSKAYEQIGLHAPAWQDCRTLVDIVAKDALPGEGVVKNHLPAGTEVFADPLIVTVFSNMMDNAVRHGGMITTIRFSGEEQRGAYHIVCEDDGMGVPAGEKEQIFEQGYGKNTGLGLFLAREILAITGITIRETGEPGKGARFEIVVPKGTWRSAGKGA